jgi:hypothetical protein
MPVVRSVQETCVWLALISCAASCSIPGIRPEGRTVTVSANAPAGRADVYARAREWFARNGYTIARDVPSAALGGHRTIATEADVETRAVVDLAITSSTAENTAYRVTSQTERGRPPAFQRVEQNAPEAGAAVSSLVSYLSCPTARWPRCP